MYSKLELTGGAQHNRDRSKQPLEARAWAVDAIK